MYEKPQRRKKRNFEALIHFVASVFIGQAEKTNM